MSKIDTIVKTYKTLAQIPALAGATIGLNGIITSVWSQRNIELGKTTKFARNVIINNELETIAVTQPLDISNELLSSVSSSEKFRAVLRDIDNKQFLEVWQQQNLIRSVDLAALDVHGNIYSDVEFGTFEWSPDEKKLLYVAEKKVPKSEPFYKRKTQTDESGDKAKTRGEECVFEQDWGEQLVGKKKSIIAQYDVENDNVEILEGIPDSVCPAYPKYSPDGTYLVGVAYNIVPRKLGLIYCTNRPSTVFKLDFEGNYSEIKLEDKAVKAPRFTGDGKSLIWLQRKVGGPHAGGMTLVKTSLPIDENSTVEVVVPEVATRISLPNGETFYGLFNTGFPKHCWASGNRLLLSTNQRNTINSYVINVDTGDITELFEPFDDGSLIVLAVRDDVVVANRRNVFVPDQLLIGKLPGVGSEKTITWSSLTTSKVVPGLENCRYEYLELSQPTGTVKDFTAIYLGPKTGNDKEVPLIVWPHGGPHSAFANNLMMEASLFLSFNYALLLINFRGSTGAGQDTVDFLPGKVGDADVADCILATDTALKKYPWLNPDSVSLVGGSHGGFLVTHLSGQYPDKFKAVVARNPVIDVASMSIISDIPDWCYVEAGKEYTQVGPVDDKILSAMRLCSPIVHAHKVKAPTLLQIGSKDLRVPPHQGTEYYHRLKANGVTVKMNLYDDNHPLGTVPNEMDNIINTLLWIEEHAQKK